MMPYTINTVDVWAGTVSDRPGGAAEKLSALSEAGVNLEFVIGRRDKTGRVSCFVRPLREHPKPELPRRRGYRKPRVLNLYG